MWKRLHLLRKPEGEGGGGGGSAAPAAAPATAPASGPAAAPPPGAAAPAASPAPTAAPASSAPAASPAPTAAPAADKGVWPENWRETVSKDDAKKLAQLQRYGSPEAAMQALFAAQERIRSGELLPKLGKNPTADELKEWRAAHGVPETPDKYDLGKDFKVEEENAPFLDMLKKTGHETNQSPQQIRATYEMFKGLRDKVLQDASERDVAFKTECDDALRAEWGGEFRRNENLITGLFDVSGSQDLKESVLNARLPDGRRLADSPEAKRLLLNLALINNPTGTVVPAGDGQRSDGIKDELAKLQQIPASKKTEAQSKRERDLIDHALKSGYMKPDGSWKD